MKTPKEIALEWFRKELNLSIGMSDTRLIEKALDIAISETKKEFIDERQGLITTIEELRKIADEQERYFDEFDDEFELDIPMKEKPKQKIQLNIINEEGCSDTWRFEETK